MTGCLAGGACPEAPEGLAFDEDACPELPGGELVEPIEGVCPELVEGLGSIRASFIAVSILGMLKESGQPKTQAGVHFHILVYFMSLKPYCFFIILLKITLLRVDTGHSKGIGFKPEGKRGKGGVGNEAAEGIGAFRRPFFIFPPWA